jgi:hypothetical protein
VWGFAAERLHATLMGHIQQLRRVVPPLTESSPTVFIQKKVKKKKKK